MLSTFYLLCHKMDEAIFIEAYHVVSEAALPGVAYARWSSKRDLLAAILKDGRVGVFRLSLRKVWISDISDVVSISWSRTGSFHNAFGQ
jgi:anaphase-promoting complex subunit 4